MHRNELLKLLSNYQSRFMDEVAYVRRAIDFIKENENVFNGTR